MRAPTDPTRSVRHGDARNPSRERIAVIGLTYLLLIVSIIPWRSQSIYEGGLDPVVVGKAFIALIALAIAAALWVRTRTRMPIGLAPAGVLAIVLLVSTLGSILAGNFQTTIVLVVRTFMILATILLLLSCSPWLLGVCALLTGMAVVAFVAAVTGIGLYLQEGRLGGGIPEIHPNELAGLAGPPLVGLVVLMLRRGVSTWSAVSALGLLFIVVASGSRTALAALVVAIVVALVVNGIRNRSIVFVLLLSLPIAYATAAFTDILDNLATRGGSTDATSTLGSRFDAWSVVLGWDWASWQKWVGLGLSTKTVPVDIRWRDEQVLDSSWVSILAQSGLIGVALVGALCVWCVATALTSQRRRWLVLPLLSLLLLRSVTESGLVDSAMPFVMLVTLSTVLTHRSRHAEEWFTPTSSDVHSAVRYVA